MTRKRTVWEELNQFDIRIVMVFAIACVVIITYQYYGRPLFDFLLRYIAGIGGQTHSLYKSMAWHLGSFLMLFAVPLSAMGLVDRFTSRKYSPFKYTFTLGDYKTGLKLVALFVSVTVSIHVLLTLFGVIPEGIYPSCKSPLIRQYLLVFLLFELTQCLYMFGFEYFFRGFLVIEAEALFGNNALAVTLLPYIMIKFGKPPVEIYTAILVGIALAYMTIRTRSFVYAALSHFLLAAIVDVISLIWK